MRLRQRLLETTRRQRAVAVATALAAVALLAWFIAVERGGNAEGAARVAPAFASTRSVPMDPAALPSPSAVEPDARQSLPGNERVEVCGLGWVEAEADGSVDTEALMALPAAAAARERVLAALRNDVGGIGEFVAIDRELFAPREGKMPLAWAGVCGADKCPVDELEKASARRLLDRLATVASASNDPDLYAFAFRRCERSPDEGACALLSAAQWSRLDPGNALPWLGQLDLAYGRKDQAAIDDALFHIGHAERLDDRPRRASEAIFARMGSSDVDSVVGHELVVEIVGRNMAQSISMIPLYRVCTSTATDANRRQACEDAARTMTTKSDSFITAVLGNTVGRRLGWSAERLDEVDMLSLAVQEYWSEKAPPLDPARPMASLRPRLDCKSVRDSLVSMRKLTQGGEVELGRERLAGMSDPERLRQQARRARAERVMREREEERKRVQWAAEAAASAASTPYSAAPPPSR